jgi:hypothetical protein
MTVLFGRLGIGGSINAGAMFNMPSRERHACPKPLISGIEPIHIQLDTLFHGLERMVATDRPQRIQVRLGKTLVGTLEVAWKRNIFQFAMAMILKNGTSYIVKGLTAAGP